MKEEKTRDVLTRFASALEVHKLIATYQIWREDKEGNSQKVKIEIWDAGESSNYLVRYSCTATTEDGRVASGNPDESVEMALSCLHWQDLDLYQESSPS